MRWVFIGVVALNILYFGWHLVGDGAVEQPQQTPSVAEAPSFPTSLQLLSERPGGAPRQTPVASPITLAGCPAIGPFVSEKDAKRALTSISQQHFAADLRQLEVNGSPVYWVYIPPYPTRALAMRQLRELHSRGVDSFVVSDGGDANAISLGSFSNRDSARGVQSRMRAAGYPAEIREQAKDLVQTWVVLTDPKAQGFTEVIPGDLSTSVRVQRVPCAH